MAEEIIHNTEEAEVQPVNEQNAPETEQEITPLQSKIARTLEYYNNPNTDKYKDVEERIKDSGMTMSEYRDKFVEQIDLLKPIDSQSISYSMPDNDHLSNIYDFQNSVWDDFATSFQGGLNRIGYGLGTTIPGIAASTQKSGESPEWASDIIKSMGEWHEATKERTSAESKQSFFETGGVRAFAGGLGSGAASMAPMVLSFIPVVGKAMYLTTTFADVFGSILESGKENGLSLENSSRMALSLAIPITALEKIGSGAIIKPLKKNASKYFSKGVMNEAIKKMAKDGSKGLTQEAFEATVKTSLKELGKRKYAKRKAMQLAKGFGHGAGYEGVTETLQSIVEQTGEVIFDTYKDADTKGKYGTEWGSKKFWLQAAEEGFYGAILGGVMGGGARTSRSLSEQSTYGYVRSSLQAGKPENINALKNQARKLKIKGKFTPEQYNDYIAKVDQMVKYESEMWHKIDSPLAKYQTYNQMVVRDKVKSILESDWLEKQDNWNAEKKKEISDLATAIKKDSETIINAIVSGDKMVQEKRAERDAKIGQKIKKVLLDVNENIGYSHHAQLQSKLTPDLASNIQKLNDLLPSDMKVDPLNNEEAENEGKIQAVKDGVDLTEDIDEFGGIIKKDGFILTQKALLDEDGFNNLYIKIAEAKVNEDQTSYDEGILEMKEEYGLDRNAMNYLNTNPQLFNEEHQYSKKVEEAEKVEIINKSVEDIEEEKNETIVKKGETLREAKKRISKEFKDSGGVGNVVNKIGEGLSSIKEAINKKKKKDR